MGTWCGVEREVDAMVCLDRYAHGEHETGSWWAILGMMGMNGDELTWEFKFMKSERKMTKKWIMEGMVK